MLRSRALLMLGLLELVLGCTTHPKTDTSLVQPLGQEVTISPSGELAPAQAAKACLVTGKTLAGKGHDREAIQEYELARQKDPNLPDLAWRLAVLHDRQGNAARAEIEYRSALQSQPRNPDLLNDMGYFYYRNGQYQEAEKVVRAALEINSRHAQAWGNLGMILGSQGRVKESYEAFARVVRPAQAHANVGILLAREGHPDEARQELSQALALEPNLPQARTVLAHVQKGPTAEIRSVSYTEEPGGH